MNAVDYSSNTEKSDSTVLATVMWPMMSIMKRRLLLNELYCMYIFAVGNVLIWLTYVGQAAVYAMVDTVMHKYCEVSQRHS